MPSLASGVSFVVFGDLGIARSLVMCVEILSLLIAMRCFFFKARFVLLDLTRVLLVELTGPLLIEQTSFSHRVDVLFAHQADVLHPLRADVSFAHRADVSAAHHPDAFLLQGEFVPPRPDRRLLFKLT